jgi:hypothetical protein
MGFSNYGDVAAALAAESANWSPTAGHTDPAVRANALAARAWWAGYQPPSSPAAPPAAPPPPPPPPGQKQTSQVKISAVNVINRNYEATSVEQMERLYFQNVGGTEILSVARHDTVGGEEVVFNNVDNLSELRSQFNPLNILMTTNINSLFSEYGVDIGTKIGALDETFSMNADGGIDIEVFNVNRDEYVQVQIAKRVGEEEFGLGTMWYNRSEDK